MKKRLSLAVLLFAAFALASASAKATGEGFAPAPSKKSDTAKAFFKNVKKLCGKKFAGATVFPQNADHPMVGKQLVMRVGPCTEREIRIPFDVGEDRSRTWILTLTSDGGLLFKHDHRHADGTPDKITMYGGLAAATARAGDNASARLQRFPADAHTTQLIPEAATNVWTLAFIPEQRRFMYYLERNGEPRYRAYFDLSKPL